MEKHTKIIATIGPASCKHATLAKLHKAGMNIARLNFSHGTHETHKTVIDTIRDVNSDIAIMLDTKGPEIRTGTINEPIPIEADEKIIITSKPVAEKHILIDYKELDKIKPGTIILIDDGHLQLKLIKRGLAQAINAGTIESRKSVTFQGHTPNLAFLTPKDKADVKFGVQEQVDFIAASFVRNAKDIEDLRKLTKGTGISIIAKIECAISVENRIEIAKSADGIMIARGDLGVEVNLEKVPNIQQQLIRLCNELGKPVIVATQMLESMRENPRPTRAEVADVANAILQGADAIMLSAETATGKYPLQAVSMMTTIAKEYDRCVQNRLRLSKQSISQHIAGAAYHASEELEAKLILTPTRTGYTARNVSRFKPRCNVLAITKSPLVHRQLQISWGITARLDDGKDNKLHRIIYGQIKTLYTNKKLKDDDIIIITAGYLAWGKTNRFEIYRVKEVLQWKNKIR